MSLHNQPHMSNTNVVDFPLSPDTISAALAKLASAKPGGLDVAMNKSGTFIMHKDTPVALVDRSTGSVKFEEAGQMQKFEVKAGETMDVVDLVGKTMPGYSRAQLLNEFRGTVEAVETDSAKRDETVNQGIRSGNITRARKQAKTTPYAAYLEALAELGKPLPDDAAVNMDDLFTPADMSFLDDDDFGLGIEPADIGTRTDGVKLLHSGASYSVQAPPGSGKSFVAQALAAEVLAGGGNVLYLDYEDSNRKVARRLVDLGVSKSTLKDSTRYFYNRPPVHTADAPNQFAKMLAGNEWSLIVLDGVNRAMGLAGYDSNSDKDTNAWVDEVARVLEATGATVVRVDHTAKNGNDSSAKGSGSKDAALTGASLTAIVEHKFGPGRRGVMRLKVNKDRPGWLTAHAVEEKHEDICARFIMDERTEGELKAYFTAPSEAVPTEWPPHGGGQPVSAADLNTVDVDTYKAAMDVATSQARRAYVAALYAYALTGKGVTASDVHTAWAELGTPPESKHVSTNLNRSEGLRKVSRHGTAYFTPIKGWEDATKGVDPAETEALKAALEAAF